MPSFFVLFHLKKLRMRRLLLSFCLILVIFQGLSQSSSLTTTQQQLDLEKKFDSYPQPGNIDQLIKDMSAHPHHVGLREIKPYRIISITNLKAGVMK